MTSEMRGCMVMTALLSPQDVATTSSTKILSMKPRAQGANNCSTCITIFFAGASMKHRIKTVAQVQPARIDLFGKALSECAVPSLSRRGPR